MGHFSIVRHGSLYAAGDVGERCIGLAMLPVYLYTLAPTGFGVLALVQTLTGLGTACLGLGLYTTVTRYYYNPPPGATGPVIVGTCWPILLGLPGMVLGAVATVALLALPRTVLSLDVGAIVLPALLITYFNVAFVEFALAVSRTRRQPGVYVSIVLSRAFLTAGLASVLLLGFDGGATEVVQSQAVGSLAVAAGCSVYVARISRPIVNIPAAKSLLGFGAPLIPQSAANWAVRLQDRLLLERLTTLNVVGLYSMAYKLASPLQIVLEAAFRVIQPSLSAAANDPAERSAARGLVDRYAIGGVTVTLAGVTIAPGALGFLLPQAYLPARDAIQIILIGILLLGLFRLGVSIGILFRGQRRAPLVLTLLGVVVNGLLNLLLIPAFGLEGVAVAGALTFGMLASLTWLTSPVRELLGADHRHVGEATVVGVLLLAALCVVGMLTRGPLLVVTGSIVTVVFGTVYLKGLPRNAEALSIES